MNRRYINYKEMRIDTTVHIIAFVRFDVLEILSRAESNSKHEILIKVVIEQKEGEGRLNQ